ncbi:MAG TPA: divalent-cation tolerance protein CutA [Spirochaetota bacterium]|nr:divalent-cation tolerance protein CutA [Spirochaetota bacterium]HPH02117.1 divalent-cation tolerance protein CutA [Spirochaetota bacterium]HPN82786.1 divalent-cation tolerance protein CutA [Spirochaetota bacterium]
MRIVISNCRPEEADRIVDTLLSEQLISSCNILPSITTKAHWKGEIQTEQESILIMRTRAELVWQLESRILEINSFEMPEVAAIEVQEWNKKYLKWIYDSTKPTG